MNKTCGSCAIYKLGGDGCPYLGTGINETSPACAKHQYHIDYCFRCGRPILDTAIVDEVGKNFICTKCFSLCGTCHSCTKAIHCAFEEDPSSEPKTVQQRIQKGPMIQIVEVRNPSRVSITCAKNCPCFDPNFGCCRENNPPVCKNYEEI